MAPQLFPDLGSACTQSDELVDLSLVDFDYLVTKKKIEEEDDFMQLVNPHTRFETAAQGTSCCLASALVGSVPPLVSLVLSPKQRPA